MSLSIILYFKKSILSHQNTTKSLIYFCFQTKYNAFSNQSIINWCVFITFSEIKFYKESAYYYVTSTSVKYIIFIFRFHLCARQVTISPNPVTCLRDELLRRSLFPEKECSKQIKVTYKLLIRKNLMLGIILEVIQVSILHRNI